ncbi:aromatic ring-hydroxylating dioxygenase subunit alpha [soil metagenome]
MNESPNHLQRLLGEFDPSLPLERARTIPSNWYTDSTLYRAECDQVFRPSWVAVGRVDQVAEPGMYLTAELAGEPLLVVRDQTGTLRAFYNLCRHRAARVAVQDQGRCGHFRCRYHGWTYDLDGRLLGTPEFGGVEDFKKEDQGLAKLAVDAWGPLVFVHAGEPRCTLKEYLNPLAGTESTLGLDRLKFAARREYQLACNWKVFVDNYLDGGYHINTIHPGLAGLIDYSKYRTTIAGNTCLQSGPLTSNAESGEKTRTGTAYYWWVFPNLMLNVYAETMDINIVLPDGPDRCRVLFDFYFLHTEGPEAKRWQAESIAVSDQIQAEDGEICEDVQRGLHSSNYSTGRFCVKREVGGYHFHRLLAERLEKASKV